MKNISYHDYMVGQQLDKKIDVAIHNILSCIDYIYDADAIYTRTDYGDEELVDFVENLLEDDFNKIQNFVESQPTLKKSVLINCPECGNSETIILQGLTDFLE